jgi:hypothetical protein
MRAGPFSIVELSVSGSPTPVHGRRNGEAREGVALKLEWFVFAIPAIVLLAAILGGGH